MGRKAAQEEAQIAPMVMEVLEGMAVSLRHKKMLRYRWALIIKLLLADRMETPLHLVLRRSVEHYRLAVPKADLAATVAILNTKVPQNREETEHLTAILVKDEPQESLENLERNCMQVVVVAQVVIPKAMLASVEKARTAVATVATAVDMAIRVLDTLVKQIQAAVQEEVSAVHRLPLAVPALSSSATHGDKGGFGWQKPWPALRGAS